MTYAESVFTGTAAFYARYRPPYPQELIKHLVAHYGLDGSGRMLDLGCGPGTLTFPLAPHMRSIVAIDVEPSMIEEAQKIQQSFDDLRQRNIQWRVMSAEGISHDLGSFRLVTCGSSFHWMSRDLVLKRIRDLLEPDGGVALVGGISAWQDGPEDWHQVVTDVLRRYLGDRRRVGNFWGEPTERFEQALERNGWTVELARDYPRALEWDVESVLGHLWSTSFANRLLFGDKADEFESELRAELLQLNPGGVFKETAGFGLVCGRPPA